MLRPCCIDENHECELRRSASRISRPAVSTAFDSSVGVIFPTALRQSFRLGLRFSQASCNPKPYALNYAPLAEVSLLIRPMYHRRWRVAHLAYDAARQGLGFGSA